MNVQEFMDKHRAWTAVWPMPTPEGFAYADFPAVPTRVWEFIVKTLEPFEMKLLTFAEYGNKTARGQIFVKPEGLIEMERALTEKGDAFFADEEVTQ